jgi:hypothetical protein
LWKPVVLDGQIWTVGGPDIAVPLSRISKKRPAWGGTLARLLYPAVLAEARTRGFASLDMEAFGWLPPPLIEEGDKVQASWLKKYLLGPTTIRPAGIMPMPKFNFTEEEANSLVAFFAAQSKAEENSISSSDTSRRKAKLLDQALQFITDTNNYCARCHLIGDYRPAGDGRTNLAPNLAEVGRRLQPHYLRRWLGDPKMTLPYTPMPQNFPPEGEPGGQELLPGSSLEQLDAVERLLIEYDDYAKAKMSIQKMIPQPPQGGL